MTTISSSSHIGPFVWGLAPVYENGGSGESILAIGWCQSSQAGYGNLARSEQTEAQTWNLLG